MRGCVLDRRDNDRVVAALVSGDDAALEMSGRALEQRDSVLPPVHRKVVESIDVFFGEAARDRLLIFSENADPNELGGANRGKDRRIMSDAHEDERR